MVESNLEESQSTPSVSYSYHSYMGNVMNAIGGPIFILLYIQCAMFVINSWLHLSMEFWQLVFPTFVVVMSIVIGVMNK